MAKILLRALARAGLAALLATPAVAQVQRGAAPLPLTLAIEAAQAAIAACEAQGWPVTVSVVDTAGVQRLLARGDHTTIHTDVTAFRKAYTVVTLGPIFRFDASSAFAQIVAANPGALPLTGIPNVIALAGGVAVKRGDEIVAAIGVGGAPGGDKDEACARAGLARIADRLR
jgi:uncharacterized protein GlcG (DUF336 family)